MATGEAERDGGIGREEEGEPRRAAVRILISSNWSLREQKLGEEKAGSGRAGRHSSQYLTE